MRIAPRHFSVLAAIPFALSCTGSSVLAPTGMGGTGGNNGQDASAAEVPGPFAGWTTCQVLSNDRPWREAYALSASRDGRWLALLDSPFDGRRRVTSLQSVILWNLPGTTVARRITDIDYGSLAADVDVSPDGAWVAITGDGAQLVRTGDGEIVWQHGPPTDVPATGSWLRNFAFSPDGLTLASARSYQVDLYRAADGGLTRTLVNRNTSSPGIAISPDGLLLASSAPKLWRLADQTPIWDVSLAKPAEPANEITDHWATFSPDGKLILLQYARLPLRGTRLEYETDTQINDTATGALAHDLGSGLARRPTFSPDGRLVLAGDRLVDLDSGASSSLGAPATISHFLADGRIFAAADDGARVLCPR